MNFIPINKFKQYEEKIKPLLERLANGGLKADQVFETLRQFKFITSGKKMNQKLRSYDTQNKSLEKIYANEVPQIFSKISKIVLQAKQNKQNCCQISFLQSKEQKQIQFTKKQMVYLMSLMSLNLVPPQQYAQIPQKRSKFSSINNFSYIFDDQEFKTQAIIEYFKDYFSNDSLEKDDDVFTIRRQVLNQNIQEVIMKNKTLPMKQFKIASPNESIYDYIGHAIVDFANKFIGGGTLQTGCFQEQIMFANHPQLFTSVMFCQVMEPNQALFFTGYKKYFKNIGYAEQTIFGGKQNLRYEKDQNNRTKSYIIAIDAIPFGKTDHPIQATKQNIDRQLTKAYAGFNIPEQIDIVSGAWGCGVFNGDIRLKFLIQWIACSLAKKRMVFFPHQKAKQIQQNSHIIQKLSKKNVQQVYNLLISGSSLMNSMKQNIFQKIQLLL